MSSLDPIFGPYAQTSAQRAQILQHMQRANPGLHARPTAYVANLHARYVAGELSWKQVCALREASHDQP